MTAQAATPVPVTTDVLRTFLDGRWAAVRDDIRARADDPRLGPDTDPDASLEERRARTLDRLRLLAEEPYARAGLPPALGGTGDLGGSITAFEMLGHLDLSLQVKAGVQFGLFAGALAQLGSERHRALLDDAIAARLLGCFAMTETGHGSNVQALETTADHDPATDELIVHTPTPSARKDYIGGAARDARMAAVFARLRSADGTDHGVHCVLVPLRDAAGATLPGITIDDCGGKGGLDGVDNGRIAFEHVRVPRTSLLDRFGGFDAAGAYTSPIADPSRRFFTMIGTLVRGRVSVAGGAGAATRTALTLATRYAAARRQFGPPGGEEVSLLTYPTHQRLLLPAIADAYALAVVQNDLVVRLQDVAAAADADPHPQRRLESRAAGLKWLATSTATTTIQRCREACGGAGYLAENRLVGLRADVDVFTTFEGDNTVLLQLLAQDLLGGLRADLRRAPHGRASLLARVGAAAVTRDSVTAARVRTLARAARLDTDACLVLLRQREHLQRDRVALRLAPAADMPPGPAFRRYLAEQRSLVALAQAHVRRVVAEEFAAAVATVTVPSARRLLRSVCRLHALAAVDADRAWFVENGLLTPAQSRRIPDLVDRLCRELAGDAVTLVDGFGIPPQWARAPMLG